MNKTKSRKCYIAILFISIFYLISISINAESDLKKENLKGEIKTIIVERASLYQSDGKWKEGKRLLFLKYVFNKDGNQTEYIVYNKDGTVSQKSINNYNDKGKKIELIIYEYDKDKINKKSIITYGENELESKKIVYSNEDIPVENYTYSYSYKDNKIDEATEYGKENKISSITTYFYMENKIFIIANKKYDNDGKVYYINIDNYKNGDVVKSDNRIDYSGLKLNRKFTYTYDNYDTSGNWIKRTIITQSDNDKISGSAEYRKIEYNNLQLNNQQVNKTTQDFNGFRSANWGISKPQVRKLEKLKIYMDNKNVLAYEGTLADLSCVIAYIFAEEKLVRGKYLITSGHTNKNDYIDDYLKLKDLLIKKYGDPVEDNNYWKDDLYKDDYSEWGMAISVGHLVYYTKWENASTEIILNLYGENYNITLMIQYTSIKLKDLEEKTRQNEELNKL